MIYLIDDKRKRQTIDFDFNEKKIKASKNFLETIYDIKELMEKSEEIFRVGNTILYHESFLDNSLYSNEALVKRKRFEDFAENNKEFNLVFFSGSKSSRNLNGNIAHIPVSILYLNLEAFLFKAKEGIVNLKFLLFGNKPEIESELNKKLIETLALVEDKAAIIPNQKTLVFRTAKDFIQNAIENAEEETLYNLDVSDAKFTKYIDEFLVKVTYDNIFIPLCFGKTLSDYNGLRLATLIRCTDTINQLTNIYIYGFVGIDSLLNHGCFNILKTKNIELVTFQKSAFQKSALAVKEVLTKEELSYEIQKLKLNMPKDFDDNHAIANEWAIYKWNYSIPYPIYDIVENVLETVENRLYFRYLQTLYPTSEFSSIREENLKILTKCKGKVLLIDDNYKKGWFDIFKSLFKNSNDLQLDNLEINFRALNRDQIVEAACNKVIGENTGSINYDVLILDFRLHSSDNNESNIDLISGMQILNKLKKFNPGIQVIIFSATNKTWNLKALQEAGADGFILKESPENSFDSNFTKQSIENMLQSINDCFENSFLKDFYVKYEKLKTQLIPRKNFKKSSQPLPKEFVDEVLKWLEMSFNILKSELSEINMTSSFIIMFSVLENLSNRVIDSENPIKLTNSDKELIFEFEYRKERIRLKKFKQDQMGYYIDTGFALNRNNTSIPWAQKILNTLSYINTGLMNDEDLNLLVKKRNDIIHANSTMGSQVAIDKKDILLLHTLLYNGLKNVI